jgi:hypothetical protein
MPLAETIAELKALDLSTYPVKEIMAGFKKFGKIAYKEVTLHPGKKIIRASPNKPGETFLTAKRLSYKPQELNDCYQRASTPETTRFYGSITPEGLSEEELSHERYVVSLEVSKWLRNNKTCGLGKITYSRWDVTKDVRLIAIAHRNQFYDASSYIRKLVTSFDEDLKKFPELTEETLAVSDYIAGEFAKEEYEPDYHYIVAALFTDMVVRHGFDGVLYPSVRVRGGFNIALTPDAADHNLKFIGAGECLIYKRFKNSIIDNATVSVDIDKKNNFSYSPIAREYQFGEQEVLRRLGIKSINDLCIK